MPTLQWRHNERHGVSNHQFLIVYSTVCLGADQRKHQSSSSLAFVRRIHRGSVNSPNKGPVTRKIFPFDDVIMRSLKCAGHRNWTSKISDVICRECSLYQYDNSWKNTKSGIPAQSILLVCHVSILRRFNVKISSFIETETSPFWHFLHWLHLKFDNFQCSQWRRFCQIGDISVSVYTSIKISL